MRASTLAIVVTLCSSLIPLAAAGPAWAGWERAGPGGAAFLTALGARDAAQVAVSGATIDTGNLFAPLTPRIYLSGDGGLSFEDVSGSLDDTPGPSFPQAVHFVDARHGFVALGDQLARTTDGGETWTLTPLGFEGRALHFFDTQVGLVAGAGGHLSRTTDGGATFSAVETGVATDLRGLFFLDAERGWFVGHDEVTADDPFGGAAGTTLSGGVVLQTTDGGRTLRRLGPEVNATLADQGLGPIAFLPDGQTGFLATYTRPDPAASATVAHFFTTKDGGASWQPRPLPESVGQIDLGLLGMQPIGLSRIDAMSFDDARRGHLVAEGFLGEGDQSSSGSGGTTVTMHSVNVRIVDLETEDGGASFTHTDLGTVALMGLQLPPGDGQLSAGVLVDRHHGWLVADQGTVWRLETPCDANAPCGDGYACENTRCAPAAEGGEGVGGPGGGGGPGGPGADGGLGGNGAAATDGGVAGESGGGGCSVSLAPRSGGWVGWLAAGALCVFGARRRRVRARV